MATIDRDSSDESGSENNEDRAQGIQEWQFEPEYTEAQWTEVAGKLANVQEEEMSDDGKVWCRCGKCRNMPSELERVCCLEMKEAESKIGEDAVCLTEAQGFQQVCLAEDVLKVRMAMDSKLPTAEEDETKSFRHAAYRNCVTWLTERPLGAGNRLVLPSCAVWRIRDAFPAPNGQYTGFKAADQ